LENEPFGVAGIVLISEEGPSFGTPIFARNDRADHFIQSSSNESFVEEFVALLTRVDGKRGYVEFRSNRSFVVGSPFSVGFRDIEGRLTVDEKFVLQLKLLDEFEEYMRWPFLAFSIASFVEDEDLVRRITNHDAVQGALKRGELMLPSFLTQQTNSELKEDFSNEQTDELRQIDSARLSKERDEQIKKLWEAGLSANQIAAEVGNLSRNAVIGKVHRMGLSGRAKRPAATDFRPRRPPPDLEFLRREISSSGLARLNVPFKSLTELDQSSCRWPMGTPDSGYVVFCGAPALAGLPYCAYHSRMAYQPIVERRQLGPNGDNKQE